jgi:hypothetical protein
VVPRRPSRDKRHQLASAHRGCGVHRGAVDGVALCRVFNHATRGQSLPKYVSTDQDPLYRFHQWQANLRILNIREIKTVPYVPRSHPVVARLIGTIRRECLDRVLFWTAADLERTLVEFQRYTTTSIARIRGRQGVRRRRARIQPARGRVSAPIGGSRTVVGSITRRPPPDIVDTQLVRSSDLRIRQITRSVKYVASSIASHSLRQSGEA